MTAPNTKTMRVEDTDVIALPTKGSTTTVRLVTAESMGLMHDSSSASSVM